MKKQEEKIKIFDLLISALIIFILISLVSQTCFDLDPEIIELLNYYDFAACVFFVIDWGLRFKEAVDKKRFTKNNSFDLFISLPIPELFSYLGFFKILQISRIIRIAKLFSNIKRMQSAFTLEKKDLVKIMGVMLLVFLMLVSPILMLLVERGHEGNILTAEDAVWWTYCTISTIGYGDKFPVTGFGRILAVIVSLGGITLFSMCSGLVVNFIMSHNSSEQKEATTESKNNYDVETDPALLDQRIIELQKQLAAMKLERQKYVEKN